MHFPIIKNDYTKWSMVVLAGSLLASFLNYGFTLIIGRMLGPSFFGEVSTIFGLMVIFVAPTQAISNYVTRHTSFLTGKRDYPTVKVWLQKVSRFVFFFSLILLFAFWLLIPLFSRFLGIESLSLFIFSLAIPFSFILSVHVGALQGLKSFTDFSFQNILSATLKLCFATFFVYIGLLVPGVMLAIVISLSIASFYNYTKIKLIFKSLNLNSGELPGPRFFGVTSIIKTVFLKSFLTIFLAALLIALVSNTDIILAKHFLEPGLAGEYAALSAIGKILIYVASAFITVMFAVVSESFVDKKLALKTFKNTLVCISALSLPVIFVFGFAPKTVVDVFFGTTYIKIAPFLPVFSVAMFLLSISIAFIHYFLATRNSSFLLPFTTGILLLIILIILNHGSAWSITISVLWSSIFLLATLVANYLFIEKRETLFEQYVLSK